MIEVGQTLKNNSTGNILHIVGKDVLRRDNWIIQYEPSGQIARFSEEFLQKNFKVHRPLKEYWVVEHFKGPHVAFNSKPSDAYVTALGKTIKTIVHVREVE